MIPEETRFEEQNGEESGAHAFFFHAPDEWESVFEESPAHSSVKG
ncbi:MAG: hypothetical protein WBB45_15535 [Cyclobacteriaceae bacterium]